VATPRPAAAPVRQEARELTAMISTATAPTGTAMA
jgi:hypothetical protein